MKHFGAKLAGAANTVDGDESSILTIGTGTGNNDSIIIHNETGADEAAGDKTLTDKGLVIVPTASGRGATHVLGADGREVLRTDLGATANDNLFIPISTGSSFVNSAISQDVTTDATTVRTIAIGDAEDIVNITGTANIATAVINDLTVSNMHSINADNSFVADKYFETNHPVDGAAYAATQDAGYVVVQTAATTGSGATQTHTPLTGAGIRFNPAASAGDRWEVAETFDFTDGSGGAAGSGAVPTGTWTSIGDYAAAAVSTGVTSIQAGRGVSEHASGDAAVDGLTPSDGSPVLRIETTTNGGIDFSATGAAGTLELQDGGIVADYLNGDTTGAAFSALGNGTAGQILASRGNGRFQWSPAPTGTSATRAFTGTKITTATSFRILQTDHLFAGQNLNVQVYESITGGFTQIIPESILISDGSAAGVAAGDIVVTTGATATDLAYKVVITG